MFTGLIQAVGRVASATPSPSGSRLMIDADGWHYRPAPGDSIAVNGCCLTHAPQNDKGKNGDNPHFLCFDVVQQTLRMTTLGQLKPGERVNLESCLTPSSPIGGHFVQGHVDGVGEVAAVSDRGGEYRLAVCTDEKLIRHIIPQGSIALSGVSLTVAAVDAARHTLDVALIPTTLQLTNLGDLQPGDRVNLEADILAKTIVHYLEHFSKS